MRTGNMSSQEFHDFTHQTHAILWRGVACVKRARIGIEDSRRLREEARELLAHHRRRRARRRPLRGTLAGETLWGCVAPAPPPWKTSAPPAAPGRPPPRDLRP